MPSSYTSSLRLVLPVTGELTSIWGDTVNNGLTKLVEDAIAGTASVAMGDANVTLTTATEAADQARCMFITLTGALTAQRNVVCPSQSKLYYVTNNTTGGQSILFKTAAGTGVVVAPGQRVALYCDGTNVLVADTQTAGGLVEVDVASASTTSIGALATDKVQITGTTTITSFGTTYRGPIFLRFAGALTLTHSAALVLPYGGNNFVTMAGDTFIAWPKATAGVADGWIVVPAGQTVMRAAVTTTALAPGCVFHATAGFTLNTGLVPGSIYLGLNNSASSFVITQGAGLTLRWSGLSNLSAGGNRTVLSRGEFRIYVVTPTEYYISGTGLS